MTSTLRLPNLRINPTLRDRIYLIRQRIYTGLVWFLEKRGADCAVNGILRAKINLLQAYRGDQ